jgi:phosphatidylethanolamine-binding protein (PEBP) family uncharacterized protein
LPEGWHGVKIEPMGHGVNDDGYPRYDGPFPPESDDAHRYRFRLVALDLETPLETRSCQSVGAAACCAPV